MGTGKLLASASEGAGAQLGGDMGAWLGCMQGRRWLLCQVG